MPRKEHSPPSAVGFGTMPYPDGNRAGRNPWWNAPPAPVRERVWWDWIPWNHCLSEVWSGHGLFCCSRFKFRWDPMIAIKNGMDAFKPARSELLWSQNCYCSLGTQVGETYVPSSDCLLILNAIIKKLCTEDRTLRNFRRTIAFSQSLKRDFIPILNHVKDPEIIDAVIRILVNLSVPVECLLPIEIMSKSDTGRMTIFELNSFLINSKECFVDPRTTRVILDYMKKLIETEEKRKLSEEECESVNNCLLLLRNVLHIPEARVSSHSSIQNQIVWNLFMQNIDKVLIHLMTCNQKSYWGVAMVQLIAVMYKDQHVGTLQKLLNIWFEASISESSEDNESNTSPPEQGSDSSPVLTSSDPTSDSSDTGGGGRKSNGNHEGSSGVPHMAQRPQSGTGQDANKSTGKKGGGNSERKSSIQGSNRKSKSSSSKKSTEPDSGAASLCSSELSVNSKSSSTHSHHVPGPRAKPAAENPVSKRECFSPEMSDCGYATQAEHPELFSTSSNEEETPQMKRPIHQKPHIQKTRYSNKLPTPQEKKELRRKKLVKRSKTTNVNIKAMAHHVPTSEDITHILKEFTVDFLLKAYGPLVQVLHSQLLSIPTPVKIDTSHFFWLVTYFLKFATQLELDLEHVKDVLSYEIISYLIYEGVNICEALEIASREEGTDLKPFLRRQHLVVTAIKEFIQALELFGRIPHLSNEDKDFLRNLQTQISSTDDLKCMFVLLLRQFNPIIHSKQYLQDLIVTNHVLLTFLEQSAGVTEHHFGMSLINHIKQFATVDVMRQYGILLEDFESNGEYINDCVFTMMHHIGGDMNQVATLFQPNILKTFTQIWEGDFQLCDDWSDLIEYVIHRFISLPHPCPITATPTPSPSLPPDDTKPSKEEYESQSWYFAQSSTDTDPLTSIVKLHEERGISKTRMAVFRRLLEQGMITENQYRKLLKDDNSLAQVTFFKEEPMTVENLEDNPASMENIREELNSDWEPKAEAANDVEIANLTEILMKDNRGAQLSWLQRLLIEACYVKLVKDVNCKINYDPITRPLEPIPHYYSHLNQSIPVVSWNSEQAAVLLLQPFQMLLHKLGFHLPADTGKVFARIPSFWTVDVLFSVAQKLGPINSCDLKFEVKYLTEKFGEPKKPENGNQKSTQAESHHFAHPRSKPFPCLIKNAPLPNSAYHWLDLMRKSPTPIDFISSESLKDGKVTEIEEEDKEEKIVSCYLSVPRGKDCETSDIEIASVCSICETSRESVASDLTRMCMSDEEDRPEKMIFSS